MKFLQISLFFLFTGLFILLSSPVEARWYSPETGIFITKAPYPPAVEHPYRFATQNPTEWFDSDGRKPEPVNREEFCKNDPCKGKTVTSEKGNSFKGGEDCDGSCFNWAASESNNVPPDGSKPPDDGWHSKSGGHLIIYQPGGGWNTSGHGAIYDHTTGCAASCSAGTWAGGPPGKKVVVIHHPLCHPRGLPASPWRDPYYWY
jgi:hypothetical protein